MRGGPTAGVVLKVEDLKAPGFPVGFHGEYMRKRGVRNYSTVWSLNKVGNRNWCCGKFLNSVKLDKGSI